jgi:hypothetical protein
MPHSRQGGRLIIGFGEPGLARALQRAAISPALSSASVIFFPVWLVVSIAITVIMSSSYVQVDALTERLLYRCIRFDC